MEEEIIKITCPTSWDEVTLEMLHQLENVKKDEKFNIVKALPILLGMDKDEVMSLPVEAMEVLSTHLAFLKTQPQLAAEISDNVEIDGVRYMANTANKMTVGEYVATDMVVRADQNDFPSLLAIIARKEGERYDSKFENEVLNDRREMWKKVPVTKALPLISFFLNNWNIRMTSSQAYSLGEESINQFRKNIENLRATGQVSRRFMRSAEKTLSKLEKFLQRM